MKHLTVSTTFGLFHLLEKNDRLLISCFDSNVQRFTELFETATMERTPLLNRAEQQLQEYILGERTEFTVPIGSTDNSNLLGTTFENRVWNILRQIEFGRTISYKEQALWMGHPKAIRAIGRANGKNPLSIFVPCHRVIGAHGNISGYAGGMKIKRWLLEHEKKVLLTRHSNVSKRDGNSHAISN